MSYSLHQLKVFAAVARNKSMTRAAEDLYMSQPAVSIQVKKLQEHFEIELFEVIGKQLYLTEAGKELFETQKRIEAELENLDMAFHEFKGSLRGDLKLIVVSTAKYFMPYALGLFRKQNEQINISLKVTDRVELIEHLKQNNYDLAVVSQLPPDVDLEVEEFLINPLHIAAPINHPLVGNKNLRIKDLESYDFVIREKGSGTRMVMEELFKKGKIEPRTVMELSTNEAVKQAIMADIGISLISEYSMTIERSMNRISVLDIEGFPYINNWKLIYLKGKKLSPVSRSFIDFLVSTDVSKWLP
ncbi:MAG: LysR family transcriptional regulator [Balneolaceae bacterium]